jgi:hypothetical protein
MVLSKQLSESYGLNRQRFLGETAMDNLTFGFTLLVVGMGGTMASLGALALIMGLLKKIFPTKEENSN